MIFDQHKLEKAERKEMILDVMATCARCMKRWPHNPVFKEHYLHWVKEYKCITQK